MLKHLKIFNTVIKYLAAAILIVVPLFPKFPFIRVPGTFVSIRIEDLILFASFIVLVFIIISDKKRFISDKIGKAMFLYLVIGIFSLLSAILITKTVTPHIGFLHWARRVEYLVPFFLGYYALKKNPGNLGFYAKILMVVIFYAFIYGIGQRYFSWPVVITQNQEYSRGVALRWISGSHINSTFAGHYDLATFLVMVLPIVVSFLVLLKGKGEKILLTLVFLSGLWLMVSSASRVSLASYLFSSFIALIMLKKYKVIPIILVVSIMFTGFSENLVARYKRLYDVSVGRVKGIMLINYESFAIPAYAADEALLKRKEVVVTPTPLPVFEDRSTNIRFNVEWPRAIRAFSKNPLLGTGYSSITLATDNDYLRLLGEVGTLGFLSFTLIIFRIVYKYLKVIPVRKVKDKLERGYLAGMAAAIPGLLINAAFIDIFEASKFAIMFWLLTGFSVALISDSE